MRARRRWGSLGGAPNYRDPAVLWGFSGALHAAAGVMFVAAAVEQPFVLEPYDPDR